MMTIHQPPRILVVNRSLNLLNLFHDILDEQGYEVEISNYTFESLTTIEKLQPDVIILDFGREGNEEEWQLLKMLKMYPPTASIAILVCMSPLFFMQDHVDHYRGKDIWVLFNPIDKKELLTVVHQILSSVSNESK